MQRKIPLISEIQKGKKISSGIFNTFIKLFICLFTIKKVRIKEYISLSQEANQSRIVTHM